MVECLDEIIEEAKCCSASMSSRYIRDVEFGNETKELQFDYMRLNAYIRTLERNKCKIITKKEVVEYFPKKVSFSSLSKNKNSLYLNQKPEKKVICTDVEIAPCLTDSEIRIIIEEIRLLCSTCNCNCK